MKKGYLWNSGIFLISVSTYSLRNSKNTSPASLPLLAGAKIPDYAKLDSISIDYGLLEPSKKVAVVPLDTDWNDLGTFEALYEVEAHDGRGKRRDRPNTCRHGTTTCMHRASTWA